MKGKIKTFQIKLKKEKEREKAFTTNRGLLKEIKGMVKKKRVSIAKSKMSPVKKKKPNLYYFLKDRIKILDLIGDRRVIRVNR